MNIKDYIEILHPNKFNEAIQRLIKVDDARETLVNVLLLSFIGALTFVTESILFYRFGGYATTNQQLTVEQQLVIEMEKRMLTPLGLTITFLDGIIIYYISVAAFYAICRVLGGNGRLGNQLYALAVLNVSYMLVNVPLALLAQLPITIVQVIMAFASLVVLIYTIYLEYKIARAIHTSFDKISAIAAVVGYLAVMFFITILVGLIRLGLGI